MTEEEAYVVAVNHVFGAECINYHDACACCDHHENGMDDPELAAVRLALKFFSDGYRAGVSHG